ncbi:MAG: thioredoxin-dependent thiol peroxidase [Mariprofundaceae bacterium]|nr:thioredoxin-dependent thiol peroxidase [Mariprofundaceae bacterium]
MSDYHLNVGDAAPEIVLPTWPEGELALSAYKGEWVIVYFYPKDSTPGCTTESCEFRDALADFSAANANIVGVSRDSVKSHSNFTNKQDLNFPLISDAEEALCKAFDVLQLKKNYGKEYMGIERSTFIINPEGRIAHIWRKVRVKEHVENVLQTLKELKETA